jgi:tungstate transport system substrate-binding protein
MARGTLGAIALIAAWLAMGCGGGGARTLVLATTTSVAGSGLLDHLLPLYEAHAGVAVRVHAVGSGRALKMLGDGKADVAISHAPVLERLALTEHAGWTYRKIAYNDFLIVGPEADPAGVRAATDVLDAFRRLAAAAPRWVSRGDHSGTHEREQALWTAARVRPRQDRVITTGQGMSGSLRIASEMTAYTLVDRGTFEQLAPRIRVQEVFSGDPALVNTYAVMAPADGPAAPFVEWLSRGEGRARMEALFEAGTIPGFTRWPADRRATAPEDLPF